MRPALVLLSLLLTATVSAEHLRFTATPPEEISAESPARWSFRVENVSGQDRPATQVSLQLGPGTIQSISGLDCGNTGVDARQCTLPALAAGASLEFEAVTQHPSRYLRTHAYFTELEGAREQHAQLKTYWKDFVVTNTADSGPGSLRNTIIAINTVPDCRSQFPQWTPPCRAAFRIESEVPAEGWYTVRPLTPLPAMTVVDGSIDGSTQAGANPDGPTVFLDGSALASGNGVMGAGAGSFEVMGLAIGGFPGDGIHSSVGGYLRVHDNYIGVDPTGRRAHPNGSRGIVSTVMRGVIENNVISGNVRSGIFFAQKGEGTGPHIRNNRIGVAAHDDTPVGNGASGIFIGDFFGYYAFPTIEGNVIANNAHFGVALTANSPMLILGNSIRDNGGAGIDIDLDGRTESRSGVPGVQGGVVPPPVILSARYENGVTTITGYSTAGTIRRQVLLYANGKLESDGYAEGEQYLGMTPAMERDQQTFTFVYPGDLRGKYINGTSYATTFWSLDEYSFTSSEFGRAVAVEE